MKLARLKGFFLVFFSVGISIRISISSFLPEKDVLVALLFNGVSLGTSFGLLLLLGCLLGESDSESLFVISLVGKGCMGVSLSNTGPVSTSLLSVSFNSVDGSWLIDTEAIGTTSSGTAMTSSLSSSASGTLCSSQLDSAVSTLRFKTQLTH